MANDTINSDIVCSGALIYAKSTGKILFLQKAYGKHSETWGLVGGSSIPGENALQCLNREIQEEVGFLPDIIKTIPLETFISIDKVFKFYTYLCVVEDEFIPILSNEHSGWAWAQIDRYPKPLHVGLRNSFNNKKIKEKLHTIFDIMRFI